jgi:hypothetical protein
MPIPPDSIELLGEQLRDPFCVFPMKCNWLVARALNNESPIVPSSAGIVSRPLVVDASDARPEDSGTPQFQNHHEPIAGRRDHKLSLKGRKWIDESE